MTRRSMPVRRPDSARPRPGRARLAVLATLVVALFALGPGTAAYAHSVLVSASPAEGETVDRLPTQVVLTFNEDVAPGLATVRVTDGEGLTVSDGDAAVSGTRVVQPLRANPPAGSYQVAYKVTSADGHPVSGAYSFVIPASVGTPPPTVDPSDPVSVPPANDSGSSSVSTTTTTPSASASKPAITRTDAQKSSGHVALLIAMGVAVLAVALGFAALVFQRRRPPGTD